MYACMYVYEELMQKPLSAVWNFLLKLSFFSGSYVYVQLFDCNGDENNLFIAINWLFQFFYIKISHLIQCVNGFFKIVC